MDYCHFAYITKLKKIKIKITALVNLVCKEATPTLSELKFGIVCIVCIQTKGLIEAQKALPGFCPFYIQFPYLPEETCFQQAGSSVVEGTCQVVLGSSDER
jgi:hypothetical protein